MAPSSASEKILTFNAEMFLGIMSICLTVMVEKETNATNLNKKSTDDKGKKTSIFKIGPRSQNNTADDHGSKHHTKGVDVIYPGFMEGRWNCCCVVTSAEGDEGQAKLMWRTLGGTVNGGKLNAMINLIELFDTECISPPVLSSVIVKNEYLFNSEILKGVLLN